MNISTLKTLLGLDDWQCGCPTQKNEPYTRWILKKKKNRDQVHSQINSIVLLTRSFPELEAELVKLVVLVHCYREGSKIV